MRFPSAFRSLNFAGVTPFGALFTGAVIEHSNGSMGFLAAGGVGLVGALVLLGWWWGAARRAA